VLSRVGCDPASGEPAGSAVAGGVVTFPPVTLEKSSDDSFQPVACIATGDGQPLGSGRGCWVHTGLLDRSTWWLVALTFRGAGEPPASPPAIEFEIRPTSAGISDMALAGLSNFSTYNDQGELAQASGVLCTQWEFWARIVSSEPVGTKLEIQVAAAADRTGGGVFNTHYGLLASAPPT
jgi:hypothetical protein